MDCNFEGNGYGIFVGGGESIRITGNDIEGTAGAGIHASTVSGLTISGNYFESEDDLTFGGPAVLRPGGSSKGPNLPGAQLHARHPYPKLFGERQSF